MSERFEYLKEKRLEVLEAIKPICECFNIKDYDYIVKETGQTETLRIYDTYIGCSYNSIMAIKHELIPCICSEPIDENGSIFDGMPQLKVTNYNKNCDTQFYTPFCPKCGRGGLLEFKSSYLALKHWNEMQTRIRRTNKILKDMEE